MNLHKIRRDFCCRRPPPFKIASFLKRHKISMIELYRSWHEQLIYFKVYRVNMYLGNSKAGHYWPKPLLKHFDIYRGGGGGKPSLKETTSQSSLRFKVKYLSIFSFYWSRLEHKRLIVKKAKEKRTRSFTGMRSQKIQEKSLQGLSRAQTGATVPPPRMSPWVQLALNQ